jgi:3-deoxy-manno-octulosonate cytidylyltransferase (CMP-KDO synthetase)
MASTRFPGKPLVDLCGKPMIQWVYERAVRSGVASRVVIATPDHEIRDIANGFGCEVVMTRGDHPTGTDRIAEVAMSIEADVYINVQGDEPLIDANTITSVAEPFSDSLVEMASVYTVCPEKEYENPAVVKVATSLNGDALYFSRFCLPYPRSPRSEPVKQHVGIYAYSRDVLLRYPTWRQTPLELAESLEQLRFIEHGVRIRMVKGVGSLIGVDTPEQAEEVRKYLNERGISA